MNNLLFSAKDLLLNKKLFHLILIATIGSVIYSNTFNVPFHFDDLSSIVENANIKDLRNSWPPKDSRWLGDLTFALNYHFHGLNVVGYHIINLIIHIINASLVYFLVFYTFKTPLLQIDNAKLSSKSDVNNNIIALFSSLLFVSHPIQTQAVTYIVQRYASLSTLFYLLSILMYIKSRLNLKKGSEIDDEFRLFSAKRMTFYVLSLIFAVFAIKTKEISFTLPFIIVIYEVFFFSRYQNTKHRATDIKRYYYLIPFLLVFIFFSLHKSLMATEEISRDVYLLTQLRVIVTYIRLLFIPVNQNMDYDYPLSHSLFEIQTFGSFLFILSIIGFAIYLFKRSRRTDNIYLPLISFGIVWFFITLSIESSIIPIKDVIYEHRLYLPGVGASIAFSSAIFYSFNYLKERLIIKDFFLPAIIILMLITIVTLGIAAYKRNLLWKDELTLLEDIARKSPNKARVHNNLGSVYGIKGLTEKAIEHFNIALRLKPDYAEVYNNLGEAYKSKGLYDKAIEHYLIALRLRPDFPEAYNNLGVAYSSKGQIDKAIELFLESIKFKYEYAEAHNNLGVAYKSKSLNDKAIEHYRIALKIKPDFIKARLNLGLIFIQNGEIECARREFETALKINPDDLFARHFLESISSPNKTYSP